MKVMVVDDEVLALNYFKDIISQFAFVDEVVFFQKASEAMAYAEKNEINMAFLDVEMPGMKGLEMAERLRLLNQDTVLVFVTAYPQYALKAFELEATGYVLKPYTESQIQKELIKYKRYRGITMRNRVYVKTFGGFDIFVDDKPLHFCRSKSKELLALLIDRRGGSMTSAQIASYLWEDREYDNGIKEYLKKIYQCLKKVLQSVGSDSILIESYNSKSVNIRNLTCDFYSFLDGDPYARKQYMGDYMVHYSWAEETNGQLYQMKYNE